MHVLNAQTKATYVCVSVCVCLPVCVYPSRWVDVETEVENGIAVALGSQCSSVPFTRHDVLRVLALRGVAADTESSIREFARCVWCTHALACLDLTSSRALRAGEPGIHY